MDMRHEPVRIPGYVALGAAMLLAAITTYLASASLLAAVAAALGVIVPGAAGVEYARSHAWSPESVEVVTREAYRDGNGSNIEHRPETLLDRATKAHL